MIQNDSFVRSVNIGEVVSARLSQIGMSKSNFAKSLGIDQSNLNKFLKKQTIDTGKLVLVSRILKYNFFEEFLPNDKYIGLFDEKFSIREVNIGALIAREMKLLGITQAELVEKLRCMEGGFKARQADISKIINNPTIDTAKLTSISLAIGYNFFELFCIIDPLSEEYETYRSLERLSLLLETENKDKSREENHMELNVLELIKRIEQLAIENSNLRLENSTLRQKLTEAGISV